MIEELMEILIDWPLGTIIGIISMACILAIVGLIGYGAYWAIDSWWQPIIIGYGQISDKEYTPSRIQTIMIYNPATKTSMPQTQYIPDNWELYVKINETIGSISVSKETYDSAKIEQNVFVKYKTGRLNRNNVYLTEITLSN